MTVSSIIATLGSSRKIARVGVSDVRGIASMDYEPVTVEIRTQMKISEAIIKIRSLCFDAGNSRSRTS